MFTTPISFCTQWNNRYFKAWISKREPAPKIAVLLWKEMSKLLFLARMQPVQEMFDSRWYSILQLVMPFNSSHFADKIAKVSTGHTWSARKPLLVKLPKSKLTTHLHSFVPLFSCLWNQLPQSVQSHSSLQGLKTAVHHYLKPGVSLAVRVPAWDSRVLSLKPR